jgi:hypothetical protein
LIAHLIQFAAHKRGHQHNSNEQLRGHIALAMYRQKY